MKKQIIAAVLMTGLLLSSTGAVHAQNIDEEVTVLGAGIQVTQTAIKFDDVTLDVKKSQFSKARANMFLLDARGTEPGYGVNLKISDFVLKKIVNGSEVDFKIPSSAVSVTTIYKNAHSGLPVDFEHGEGILAKSQPLSSEAIPILSVQPAYGGGNHEFEVDYQLILPKTLEGNNGEVVGVLQGTYSSTFTYTLTAGI